MDASSRLIWFFDHFNPYFQLGAAVLALLSGGVCFWSAARNCRAGIILLGIGCVLQAVDLLLFFASAFQEGKPFLPLAFEIRRSAYLYGRILGPPVVILAGITVFVLAFENMRRRKT